MWRRVAQSCLLVLAISAAPAAGAQAGPMAIPENLRAPQQNVRHFKTWATGVQVYVCTAKADDPNEFVWTFKAPEAELWNDQGEQVGTHYAGPTWESNDGSKVVAELVERANAPDPGAIPWLLLRSNSNAGAGAFTPVTYVQRLETVGGLAPVEGCDRSTAEVERDVEYTATYVFYIWRGDVM
jgi:Protein of unknown function (DUF3455)